MGFLSILFGLVHTTAQRLTNGTVLFAVTGHWTKVGKGLAELVRDGRVNPLCMTHGAMVLCFVSGLVVGGLLGPWNLAQFPLQHTVVGCLYAAAFAWFRRERRRLRGMD